MSHIAVGVNTLNFYELTPFLMSNTCPVCQGILQLAQQCPTCSYLSPRESLSARELSLFARRIIEARDRWAKLGRYDQAPKGVCAAAPGSDSNIGIGADIV